MKTTILPLFFDTSAVCACLLENGHDESSLVSFLSSSEKQQFNRFQYRARKKSYLMGRYCAKRAIGQLIPKALPSSISIENGALSHPIVRGLSETGLCVSLAHSGHSALALAHFDSHPCGVDLEMIDLLPRQTILDLLTQNEWQLLKQMNLPEKEGLALFWCAKESLAKAIKTGLTLPLSFFELLSIEKKDSYYEVFYTHFSQYSSLNLLHQGMMLSLTKPKKVTIYGLSL